MVGKAGTGASDPVLGASSHHLTMRALRIDRWDQAVDVESGGHIDEDPRPDAGGLRPVSMTCASGRLVKAEGREPTTLFRGGLYLSPLAGSSSLSLPFALT